MMQRWVPTLLIVLLFVVVSNSQTPTPRTEDDVVRISTSLVQLDVTVTDSKGKPITDLSPDEVEIFENGRERKITAFSYVPGTRAVEQKKSAAAEKPPILPSGPVRPEAIRRTVAIVVDDLNLSFASTLWAKEAVKNFIREQLQEGDLIAIIRTGAGMGALQQFTTDRRQLLAAADRVKYNHFGSRGPSFFALTRDVGGVARQSDADAEANKFREHMFASGTLGSLNFVIRGMRELPGRKSVILLTDGLLIHDRSSGFRPGFSLDYDAMRRLIDFANRSSVSFYPIHAAGLLAPGMTASDDVTDISLEGGETRTDGIISNRLSEVRSAHQGLRFIAENTGGFAVINSNNIPRGIRRIMDDHSYYLVGYDPADEAFDPRRLRYNKIEVKVSRPGARVRYRSGFLGITDEQTARTRSSVTDEIITALTSPFSLNQIDVRLNAIFVADAERNPAVMSFINIDPTGLSFSEAAGGMKKTSFDLVAFTFGVDGRVIDQRSKNFTVTVTREQYETMVKRGLVAAFHLPIKNSGGYQVRLAVRDPVTGKLGSANQFVEVPSVKGGKFALSGMVLSSDSMNGAPSSEGVALEREDPLRYTSNREFRAGTPLHFTYFVYNPKLERDGRPRLAQSYRLYKDNQPIFSTQEREVPVGEQSIPKVAAVSGGIMLGADLLPGDYVLEVTIRDRLNKDRPATQFIQFEIVN